MAITYEPIATTTLTTATANVTFSSISGTYTDLILIVAPVGTASLQIKTSVNNDTSALYSWTGMSGNGTSAESYRSSGLTYFYPDYYFSTTTSGGVIQYNFMNYSNTTTFKTILTRSSNAGTATMANVALYRSTSAINRIDLTASTSTFASGSVFTLYGVKAA